MGVNSEKNSMSADSSLSGTDERAAMESLMAKGARTDIPVLLQAKEIAKRLVKDDPSSANLSAFQRATTMLENAMQNNDGPEVFKNAGEVLRYLQEDAGRKIAQSTLYRDVKQGRLRKDKGGFRKRDVDRYAASLPLSTTPDGRTSAAEERQRRKEEAEIRIKEALATREEKKNEIIDRQYMHVDQIYQELAGRAVAFNAGLKSGLMTKAPALVAAVGGEQQKADILIRELDQIIDSACAEYSRELDLEVDLHGFDDGDNDEAGDPTEDSSN